MGRCATDVRDTGNPIAMVARTGLPVRLDHNIGKRGHLLERCKTDRSVQAGSAVLDFLSECEFIRAVMVIVGQIRRLAPFKRRGVYLVSGLSVVSVPCLRDSPCAVNHERSSAAGQPTLYFKAGVWDLPYPAADEYSVHLRAADPIGKVGSRIAAARGAASRRDVHPSS